MDDTLARVLALPAPDLLIGSVVLGSLLGWLHPAVRNLLILCPYRVRTRGELYRLLTGGWLHADAWHLALNMIMLHYFADQTTSVLGMSRFLGLYISAVIVAYVPTVLRHMYEPAYGTLGASGAVSAVMISAILLHPKLKLYLMFVPVPVPGVVFALGYLVYSVYQSWRAGDGINHDAHFSGAVYGGVLTYLFEPARVERTLATLATMKGLW
jgi:membrane associated rhomboid family serine protease